MKWLSLAIMLALAGCGAADDPVATANIVPTGSSQTLPDTLALPHLPLDAFLRPPPDSGRFNTLGTVRGWVTCPPCPPGALCEPCGAFGVLLEAPAPGGLVRIGVGFPPGVAEDTTLLVRGHNYAVSVEVESFTSAVYADPAFGRDSMQSVHLRSLGFARSPKANLYPLKHP